MKYYLLAFKKYLQFSGRSNRSEYWYFVLFHVIFVVVALILDTIMGSSLAGTPYGMIYLLYILVTFLPGLALTVRRLHDTDKSGWWVLISIIPLIGSIWLLVYLATEGTKGENKYGPDPNGNMTFDFESQQPA